MKKILLVASLLSVAIGAWCQQEFEKPYTFQVNPFWYRPLTDSTAELLPCQESCAPLQGEQVVPAMVSDNGHTYRVTRLGDEAFSGSNAFIRVLRLPATIEEIGWGCFNGSNVTALELPEGLRVIEEGAFFNSKLTSLHLPASVEYIGEGAFYDSDVRSITVGAGNSRYRVIDGLLYTSDTAVLLAAPKNHSQPITVPSPVRRIAEAALCNVSQQARLTLNEGLEEIGVSSLHPVQWHLEIPSTVHLIEGMPVCGRPQLSLFVFSVSPSSTHYRYEDGLLTSYDGDTLLMATLPEGETVFRVPAGTKALGARLFSGWERLPDSIVLPEGLEAIGDAAFDQARCRVNLPASLQVLGEASLRGNPYMGDLVLPAGIRVIGEGAFSASSITSVTMPDSLKVIGREAFMYCTQLESVLWNGRLEEIHADAFTYARRLVSVPPLPRTLRTLGLRALYGGPQRVEFEGAPEVIGDHALSASTVRIGEGQPPTIYPLALFMADTVIVPCGMAEVYRGAVLEGWGERFTYVEDCDGVGDPASGEGLRMVLHGRTLQVTTAEPGAVRVLDALGRTLYSGSTPATVQLPAAGVYLVHPLGGKARKVVATR